MNNEIHKNAPAFPCNIHYGDYKVIGMGMDIRTHIATACLQGILAACDGVNSNEQDMRHLATVAVQQADALIAALNA